MLAGALPVLVVIFASGVAPLNGPAIVPIASILVGNVMTAHTLVGRRAFADLRDGIDQYEAYLALGYWRSQAIHRVVSPNLHEALIPALDQTRTVGLVALPGAYIGVLLGGGSPWAAAAAQILVLVGINTGQAAVAVTARQLMARTWLLPADLKARLRS
jgi:putative ABC transport system permease protein